MPARKTAIIHYWLVGMRGGERVLEAICDIYPDADIFTHVLDHDSLSPKLKGRKIFTTFISKLPFAKTQYQKYLPFMPRALEALDLSEYDLIISCEAGPAKGVITRPDALHVTYCHSPMRYIWDQYHQYRSAGGLGARISMPLFAPWLRVWDFASAARTDVIIANSGFVRQRIAKFWRRDAMVVYPPINADLFRTSSEISDEFLWVGQMVPYKRPDLVLDAFNKNGRSLHMVGTGSMLAALKSKAKPNIRFTERASFNDLKTLYSTARALVFSAEEDFGMIPVEVMASGRPVIAFGRGGALETVIDRVTGLLFAQQSVESLEAALSDFDQWIDTFVPDNAIEHAKKFGHDNFRNNFIEIVNSARSKVDEISRFQQKLPTDQ